MKRLTTEQLEEALRRDNEGGRSEERPPAPRLEEIHPQMSAENKQRVLDEIMRVLRGEHEA